ncbi:GNAT family N-acetyltransferase [Alicyclobacillus fastidiosus]|uniref:GNAT family N-acetyltransferase n=1 Tax=Alicyclobacillus fastidiosus TaxID=392011 RepID=A0ABV5AKY2_9BACL|nr:GNAT family N-acetyltransferase [Alicyclobacillus fastidiosus]WEH08318.1 GNAT family N-acetyltransferase [Alicyclobacillus fastidiosus]
MRIRQIAKRDAPNYIALCKKLDQETKFMMLDPGERTTNLKEQKRFIQSLLDARNSMVFIAEHEDRLVGYLGAYGGEFRRNRHNAYLVIGILQQFTGKGIGTALFTEMENWAKQAGIHRLELTVMTHNIAGVSLYKKMGFTIEGIAKHSLLVDGNYVDEYYMAKILS